MSPLNTPLLSAVAKLMFYMDVLLWRQLVVHSFVDASRYGHALVWSCRSAVFTIDTQRWFVRHERQLNYNCGLHYLVVEIAKAPEELFYCFVEHVFSARCVRSAMRSGTGELCHHTVHVITQIQIYGWIVQFSGHPDTTACPPTPSRLFPVPHGREVGYGCENYAWYLKNGWRQRLSYYWALTESRIRCVDWHNRWPWVTLNSHFTRIALDVCGSY